MPSYTLVVLTNALPGRDQEFNDWYDNRHLGEVLQIPGFISARRFKLTKQQRRRTPSPYEYLALYEIETDDLEKVMDELRSRSGSAIMPITDAMAEERFNYVFEPLPAK